MRLVELVGVRLALPANTPILEIREAESPCRTLLIQIGAPEASSIHCAMEGLSPARPLTHDLLVEIIEAFEAEVTRIVITNEMGGTYYAELHLDTIEGPKKVSCRPSDAIAIAVRTGADMFAAESVLERNGEKVAPPGKVAGAEASEEMLEEFHDFIESINPEDFA